MADTPKPGSDAAFYQGCTCPRMDNAYGRGYMGGVKDPKTGETIFVYTVGCQIHPAPSANNPSGTVPSSRNALSGGEGE